MHFDQPESSEILPVMDNSCVSGLPCLASRVPVPLGQVVLGMRFLELVVTICADEHPAVFERHLPVLSEGKEYVLVPLMISMASEYSPPASC